MNNITRINHIGLRVKDFETSVNFYKQFGFEYVSGPSGPEPVAIVEHPTGININFILNAQKTDKLNMLQDVDVKYTGYTHIALEVDSADKMLTELEQLGIELSGEPMSHPTGISFFIRDPDDNVIEFIEYKGLEGLR